MTRLSRTTYAAGALAPVRIVHLGAGAFHRAHQAWYTAHAGDGWGIAAVAPRSRLPVEQLGPQGGLYTHLTRGPAGDRAEIIASVSRVLAGADPAWLDLVADPKVTVVTLTVTEAGYRPGSPLLGLLRDGIERRWRRDGGPLTVVSCDNLAGNGGVLRARLLDGAPGGLARFLEGACAFPSTVVDRITPATTGADLRTVADLIGLEDLAAIVTEPFSEWVLEDAFSAERPRWQVAGARFVDDVGPFARRKLRLLNAGHSLLAYDGGAKGYRWVHEAVDDPAVHAALVALWGEARRYLDASSDDELDAYCEGVEARWHNARLPHALAQIAIDGSTKLSERVVPTVLAARAAGGMPAASARVLGAWIGYLRGGTAFAVADSRLEELRPAARGPARPAVRVALGVLDRRLADDDVLVAEVTAVVEAMVRRRDGRADV